MKFTKNFTQLTKDSVTLAGGKGASLGEMINNNIPVPPGFVVLSTTFDKFLEISDINIEIDAIINKVDHKEMHTIENASKTIQALILNSETPKEIAKEIEQEFKKLNAKYVAVRSSATAEDSSSDAWAGQLDSFLNTTKDSLLENVKRCWASLFTPRAIFYRFEKNLNQQKISVAVVVQKMVDSEVSGIAFSVHPVTEDYNQIIIEAGFGLGEAIVSCQITPDSYVVTKDDLNILDKNVYAQERGIYRNKSNDGNEWRDISKTEGGKQCLTDEQIIELAKLIINIENHYSFPCDIEWAMEDDVFYIVQSRPITTLKDKIRHKNKEEDKEGGKVELVRLYTRERSLFFNYLEYIGNYKLNKKVVDFPLDNFIYINKNNLSFYYYDLLYINKVYSNIIEKYNNETDYILKIANQHDIYWDKVGPYVKLKRKISSVSELKKFCDDIWQFLTYMAVFYVSPNIKGVNNYYKKISLEYRKKTQGYINNVDDVFRDFIKNNFKEYFKYVDYILPSESFVLANRRFTKTELNVIRDRKENGYVFYKERVHPYNKLKYILEEENYLITEDSSDFTTNKVIGQTAYQGKAKGLVKIINSQEQVNCFREGEILVSAMTMPKYLSAMKKASAFVTDEGGITCHAAIVAREMKKPCIIGTKIATQVLKDGDEVEVDANNGVVRILKNNQEIINFFDRSIDDYQIQAEGGRGVFYLLDHIIIKQYLVENKDWPLNGVNVFSSSVGHNAKWFRLQKDQLQYKEALNKFINKPELVDELLAYLINSRDNIIKILKEKKYSKLENHELADFFDNIINCYYKVLRPSIIIRLVDLGLINKLREVFSNKKEADKHLTISSASEQKSFVLDEEISLLKLAIEINDNNLEISSQYVSDKLINISNKYCFSELGYYNEKIKTIDQYKQRLLDMTKLDPRGKLAQIENGFKDLLDKRKKVLSEMSLEGKKMVNIASKLSYVKDIYKLSINEVLYSSENLFSEIAERIGKSVDYIKDLSPLEIKALLNKQNIDESLVKKRVDNRVVISFENKFYVLIGEEADNFKDKYLKIDKSIDKFSGRCASGGNVSGKVRIILGPNDFHKMIQGEILVVMNTSPDFTPIMKKSKAIIAEEGGLTAHVSIVSRELGIPSVVGVHHITEILKDGDEVEVDADNGVVRILKKVDDKINLNYSDYQKLFQLESIFYFVNDILISNYKKLQVLFLYKDGKWSSYLPKTIIQKTMKEGLSLFKNNLKFNNYQKSFNNYKKESELFFKKIVKNKELNQKELRQFFKYATDIHYYYIKTEFFYTDLAFIKSVDNEIISKNLKILGEFKNTGRLYLNFIFFECIGKVMEILSKQFKIESEDLLCYSRSELLELFKDKQVSREIINKRRLSYLTVGSQNSYTTYSGQEANEMIDKFLPVVDGDQNVLTGVCANLGKVSGQARVITYGYGNFGQVDSFVKEMKAGEILVADTTSPELILACKKARAILTNQGGLMSHAAIVSREFKIPCIVALKNATEIIKTGDEVEVDADNGVVRILNKNKSKDLSEEILSTEWFHLGKWIEPALAAEVWLEYGLTAQQFFKSKLDNKILYLNGDFFLSKHDSDIFQKEGYDACKKHNSKFFENIYKTVLSITEEISKKSRQVKSAADFLEDYKKLTGVWMPLNNIAIGIENYVQENNPDAFRLSKGFLDIKPSTLRQIDEMNNLKHKIEKFIGEKIEKAKDIPDKYMKEVREHLEKYEWLGTHHFTIAKLTLNDLISKMKQNKDSVERFNKKKINKKDEYLVWLLDIIGFVRFKAAETSGYATYYLKDSLLLLAKEKGVSYEDIVEHTISEISLKEINKEKAMERRKNTGFYYDGQENILSVEQIKFCLDKLLEKESDNKNTTELVGLSAQSGKVRGIVKNVIRQDQMEGFEEGMILVAHKTTPDIIFAMQKASAVVTDFGGLTSHAAIIARELKKPCIVGTKIATQVLEDGDEVEVDADNGIVRIIKRV